MDERRRRAESLFDGALDLPEAEREGFLREAAAGDAALLAEVRALLAAHQRAGGILDAPAGEVAALVREAREWSAPPERVGPYRLLREIGRGGMGSVHLAERADGHFEQRVAVKLMRPGFAPEVLVRRFLAERQILASLQHPGIARLLDGGVTPAGGPFLVMEHVEGVPLDVHCDRERLDVAARVRLVLATARAVQHAHRNLVVHRDLKPSNVLVTAEGEPKLLDFGIAKLLEAGGVGAEAPLTRTGLSPMTPGYASPEQLRGGPVTTATDVYGLGVLLYEVLAGRRPFRTEGRSPGEIERMVRETAPPRLGSAGREEARRLAELRRTSPARLARTLGGDLERIVSTALRKEPERRYPSAEALADDLERWLAGRPVRARGEGAPYRARKFLRRHPWGVAAAAGFALLLGGYAATATVQARAIRAALAEAQTEREKAERMSGFLMALFEASDPSEARGDTITARELLRRGEERAEVLADQPLAQAQMLDAIGRVYKSLGSYDRAEPLLRRALALRERHLGERSEEVVQTLHWLGDLLRQTGEFEESERVLRRAVETSRALRGPDHPGTAGELSALAMLLSDRGAYPEAEGLHREALEIRRLARGEEHPDVAESLGGIGFVALQTDRLDEAERYYRRSLDLRLRLLGESHPDVALTRSNLATALLRRGDPAAAEALHREVLASRRRLYGDGHPSVAVTLNNLAHARLRQGDPAGADSLLREVLEMRRRLLGEDHPAYATALNNLAYTRMRAGDLAGAEPIFRRALDLQRRNAGPEHPNTAGALHNLAQLLAERGRLAEAERLYREALALRERILPADHRDLRSTREALEALGRR